MAKIAQAIINFHQQTEQGSHFKTAYNYVTFLYVHGDGFRELAKKINAAQEIQITAQGLRKHLIARGLKPDPSRYKTKQLSPSLQDEAYIKADAKRFNALQAKTDEIIKRCEETTLKYEQEMQNKDKEIARLSLMLTQFINELLGMAIINGPGRLKDIAEALKKEFNGFKNHSMP